NAQLLLTIAAHPAFQAGITFTNFLEEYGLLDGEQTTQAQTVLEEGTSDQESLFSALIAAAMSDVARIKENRSLSNGQILPNPWLTLGPWRMIGETRITNYTHQGEKYQVAISPSQEISGTWLVQVDTQPAETIFSILGNNDFILLRFGTNQLHAYVHSSEGESQVIFDGQTYLFERRHPPNVDVAGHSGSIAHSQKVLTAP